MSTMEMGENSLQNYKILLHMPLPSVGHVDKSSLFL